MTDTEKLALLERFMRAFNDHDADALMACMTEDCIFYAAAGPDAEGAAIRGKDAVKAAYAAIWQRWPDAAWKEDRHGVTGERGFSEWLFTGTPTDGSPRAEVRGTDLFTFRDGKIHIKDSYRKGRTA